MTSTERQHFLSTGPADMRSPFVRTADLLAGIAPGQTPINLSVGEPQHAVPDFVGKAVNAHLAALGRYPLTKGSDRFRDAAAGWLARRYGLARPLDPASEVIVLNGTREGLFLAALAAARFVAPRAGQPAILTPDPFYAAYPVGAEAARCEPVFLPATEATGFLPDLDALDETLLSRTVAIFLGSPSNPQGAVADRAYLARLIALARRYEFLVFADECYSEIYSHEPPPGILEVAGEDLSQIVVFQSLSKRSNLPGLRVGFAAGDRRFLKDFIDLRNVAAPQVPILAQEAAIAAYADEAHVAENRRLYARKFDLADAIIGKRFGYRRPAGGFYLWLDLACAGGSETAALKLWREAGLRVLPGRYIASDHADGTNPGADYVRIALVQDETTTAEALHRLVATLG